MARILLIEDNPANLELMVYLLNAYGHHTLEARGGAAGLAMAHRDRPDLILCDLQLPDIDGYEVARQIKRDPSLSGLPLIAVTAYAMVGDRDKGLAAGFDGYLPKPLAPETFVAQIEAFLRLDQQSVPLETHGPAARAATLPAARAVVLVVDDSPVNVELLLSILEPSGYAVQSATQVSAALAMARHSPPDLILSDLRMPGKDGYDLLRALKSDPLLAGIPVIIHSASADSRQEHDRAIALGAFTFIARPIEPQLLLQLVEACVLSERRNDTGAEAGRDPSRG